MQRKRERGLTERCEVSREKDWVFEKLGFRN